MPLARLRNDTEMVPHGKPVEPDVGPMKDTSMAGPYPESEGIRSRDRLKSTGGAEGPQSIEDHGQPPSVRKDDEQPSVNNAYSDVVDYGDVLVVRNLNSAISMEIADHFIAERNISWSKVCNISTTTAESISRASFESEIRTPVETFITGGGLLNQINFIVLTKGIPIRVSEQNTADDNWGDPNTIDRASVDAELALILGPYAGFIGNTWWISNPFFNGFPPSGFSRSSYGFFLVTRLIGYDTGQAKGLIDKAADAPGRKGTFVFDVDPGKDGSPGYKKGNDWMRSANTILTAKGFDVKLDQTGVFLTNEANVSGYTSWGSNDGSYSAASDQNSGFETDADLDGIPDGWYVESDPGNDLLAKDNSVVYAGSWSVKVSRTMANGAYSAIAQNVTVKQDTRYFLIGAANLSGVSPDKGAHLRIRAYDALDAVVWEKNGSASTGTANWFYLAQLLYEPIPGVTKISVSAVLSNSSGTAYFDDVRLIEIKPRNGWLPGALAETYVSTGGRTFSYPGYYGQSLIADLILDGVTGVKGYVDEPYLDACAHPDIIFDAYTDGYYLAESYYMASQYLGWMDLVAGDPKLAPYRQSVVPDLAIAPPDIAFSNPNPVEGEVIDLYANVRNEGNYTARDVVVEFYNGDPAGGGTLINRRSIDVQARSQNQTSVQWDTTGLLGPYDIFVLVDALDTVFEVDEGNNKASTQITVLDKSWMLPELYNLLAAPDPQENGGSVNITVDATDDVLVIEVWANVSYPDLTFLNVSMTKGASDSWFHETSYALLGTHSVTVWAKDDIDNWNTTGPVTFLVQDTDPPAIINLASNPAQQFSGGWVNVSADVIDDVATGEVWLNVTDPDLSWTNATMTKGAGDGWYSNSSHTPVGQYTATLWASDTSGNWNSSGIQFDIEPHGIDYILIRSSSGGLGTSLSDPANYPGMPVGASFTVYGALYNDTLGYMGDAPASSSWASSDPATASASTPGSSSLISCSAANFGSVTITVDDGSGHANITILTVLQPTPDYIKITDAVGTEVDSIVFSVFQFSILYVRAFNNTAGYIGSLVADWSMTVPSAGAFNITSGISTNFTAAKLGADLPLFQITATPSGQPLVSPDSTGLLSVLAPRPDYILLRNESSEQGPVLSMLQMEQGSSATVYAFVYNSTCGYLGVLSVAWSFDGGVGAVLPANGPSTEFSAVSEGSGNVSASYSFGGATASAKVTVFVDDATPPAPPTDVNVEVLGKDGAKLTWGASASPDVTGYHVFRTTTPNEAGSWQRLTSDPVTGTGYTDNGLEPGVRHYYYIVSVDDGAPTPNESGPSEQTSISIAEELPGEPSSILPILLVLVVVVVVALLIVFFLLRRRRRIADDASGPQILEPSPPPPSD